MKKSKANVLQPGQRTCPKCGSNWDADMLPYLKQQRDEGAWGWKDLTDEEVEAKMKENWKPPYLYGREIGIEIQGKYDGVMYYECPDCKALFNRFTGVEYIGLPL